MIKIKLVKPKIWNFEVLKGKDAWKEVVYSARVSGVPPVVSNESVFRMMVDNDYGSALEHIIIKFDLKMTKGNAPEFLEHRIISHTGYSTRYIQVSKGLDRKAPAYEVILPLHLLKTDNPAGNTIRDQVEVAIRTYENLLSQGLPKEIARYVLPFAQAVGIYHVTINLRSLLNLLSLRLCVRVSPEFRCIASQLYFNLIRELPIMRGLIGCRGFLRGSCPESAVTGVRVGKQHPFYPPCPFKTPDTPVYIPTKAEIREGCKTQTFDTEKALKTQEQIFQTWTDWK